MDAEISNERFVELLWEKARANDPAFQKEFAKLLRERSIAGDPVFQHSVGRCYIWGHGIEKNYAEAVKWFKLAAEQGYARAQCDLGYAYYYGRGVEEDKNYAFTLYQRAEEQEDAVAQNNLGVCYEHGEGVEQNHTEALRFFDLSAGQGYWAAYYNLGRMYHYGISVKQDLAKAREYYEKALANAGFEDAPANENRIKELQDLIHEIHDEPEEVIKMTETARETERTEIFISYAHKDEDYKNELLPYMKMLENTAKIEWWDDKKIKPGEKWEEKINEALSRAKVAVLMVSVHFFASDYIWRKELPKILEAAKVNGAAILWLPVRTCPYEDTAIAQYQAAIDPKTPLAKLGNNERDEEYTKLFNRMKTIFDDQKKP